MIWKLLFQFLLKDDDSAWNNLMHYTNTVTSLMLCLRAFRVKKDDLTQQPSILVTVCRYEADWIFRTFPHDLRSMRNISSRCDTTCTVKLDVSFWSVGHNNSRCKSCHQNGPSSLHSFRAEIRCQCAYARAWGRLFGQEGRVEVEVGVVGGCLRTGEGGDWHNAVISYCLQQGTLTQHDVHLPQPL